MGWIAGARRASSPDRPRGLPAAVLAAWLLAAPAASHHSLVAEFDVNDDFQLRGRVTSIDWGNPHIWFTLEVDRGEREPALWRCELGPPTPLERAGWSAADMPLGEIIRVRASRARDGSPTCSTRNIRLDDGTAIFTRFSPP